MSKVRFVLNRKHEGNFCPSNTLTDITISHSAENITSCEFRDFTAMLYLYIDLECIVSQYTLLFIELFH
jgi:hypothetical protein